jgi:hypothetical protein
LRTGLSLLIAYLFGDKVNPIYIFIGVYALSGVGLYFFLEVEEIKDQIIACTHNRRHHVCHFSCIGIHEEK